MKILHIAPLAPYNVGWTYQENLLPKYQKKQGNDVIVVVSNFENSKNGKIDVGEGEIELSDGVKIIRKKRKFGDNIIGKIISFTDVKDILNDFKPDYIMLHSLITLSVFQAIKYKKKVNKKCIIVQDNHLDENIGKRKNKFFTDLFYSYWAFINFFSKKYIDIYYGVTPWRMDFIKKRFKISKNKIELLIMGADTDEIDFDKKNNIKNYIRKKYNIEDDFVIVTGGKIEKNKNIDNLMKAVKEIKNVKLFVFGTIADNYKQQIEEALNDNVIMLGWLNNKEINNFFLASDIAIFPGQHSVLWEQACACKIPCLFANWPKMEHLNNGGNSSFIDDTSPNGLIQIINEYKFTDKYWKMKEIAESEKTDIYSYNFIAKKTIDFARDKVGEI